MDGDPGGLSAGPVLRGGGEFEEWFAATGSAGEGYAEVRAQGDSLLLTFAYRDEDAVVHCFPSEAEQVLLLVGDGTVEVGDERVVPVMGDECTFDGGFVSRVDRARAVVVDVLQRGGVDGAGRWETL